MRPLYLYGPPASGKSTLARRLAREWGRDFVDLDVEIVRRVGKAIPEIFASEGEAGFREHESAALREVAAPIVALGGGTLLDPANRVWCEERGFVCVLDVDDATIAARIAADGATRPLGDMLEKRRAHYASFAHHYRAGDDDRILLPRLLRGAVRPPVSKSHLHRLMIAEFLATGEVRTCAAPCADIAATVRCLKALAAASGVLDVGESGSTLRFLAPVAAALGVKAEFVRHGRLAERPMIAYDDLRPGEHRLRGDVSSQFVTGLLFALPLLDGDSTIVFETPLQSRGYVDMTLDVVRAYGIRVEATDAGFFVPGRQRYVAPAEQVESEADWSGAAFWFAANALGSDLRVEGVSDASHQPDRVVKRLVAEILRAGNGGECAVIDVSECPDLYPALYVVAALRGNGRVTFTGTARLRLKECDRLAAMEDWKASPDDVDTRGDHRIAMAAAVAATVAAGPVLIHRADCVAKSYPGFWDEMRLDLYAVTGWPLLKTRSPEIHNAAFAAAGVRAEMVSRPAETIEEALAFAERCGVKGMAVTIPHKLSVMKYLDAIDPVAREIGAVNTVVFRDGRRCGYNTDADGFAEAIVAFWCRAGGGRAEASASGRTEGPLAGVRAALLGAGGAAKAVDCALRRLGAAVETFHRRPLTDGFDLIVNATPVDPVPEYRFTGRECVYDLRYEPAETPLLARARAAGCAAENGFSMLEAQARGQRRLWFGPPPCRDGPMNDTIYAISLNQQKVCS